jgi:hypothetical protein
MKHDTMSEDLVRDLWKLRNVFEKKSSACSAPYLSSVLDNGGTIKEHHIHHLLGGIDPLEVLKNSLVMKQPSFLQSQCAP